MDRATSAVDRQLPVFSATGRIPFAESPGAANGSGVGAEARNGAGNSLEDEMDVDGGALRREGGWEVPETPEK
jgi:hypothetical protein